jgi:hypothetical protein
MNSNDWKTWAANFPEECLYVLEILKDVYKNDTEARIRGMCPEERLHWHKTQSGPKMTELKSWLTDQLEQHKIEPNSGLGEAISYMLKHWEELTLFLKCPGAPLDNNICEQALKKAIFIVRTPTSTRQRMGLGWATCS